MKLQGSELGSVMKLKGSVLLNYPLPDPISAAPKKVSGLLGAPRISACFLSLSESEGLEKGVVISMTTSPTLQGRGGQLQLIRKMH